MQYAAQAGISINQINTNLNNTMTIHIWFIKRNTLKYKFKIII
jgi:hypothetical protein